MRFAGRRLAAATAAVLAASAAIAQVPASSPRAGVAPAAPAAVPPDVPGYVATLEIAALAPGLAPTGAAAPEARAVLGTLSKASSVVVRVYLAQDLSRQEIVSTDFILPPGTVVLHRAGDKAYVIADPKARTYAVMDAEALLDALEGGAGILDSQYSAQMRHMDDRKVIAGQSCRKSIVTVSYVSSMPLENSRIAVQQKNDVEIWHTSGLNSAAALDHFFFKYQRDKTGEVRKTMAQGIGFPMEVRMVVTQAGSGKKAGAAQPGSVHATVTEFRKEAKLDSGLFRIPPEGYTRVERLPYFAAAALPVPGAKQ